MRKILLLLIAMAMYLPFVTAQTKEVTGKVTDKNGVPIAGATIDVKGTKTGTSANTEGFFRLTVPTNAILVISSIGFDKQEISVAGRSNIEVQLVASEQALSEVIVTALGIKREKRQLATAAQAIGEDMLNKSGLGNPLSELNGKASGLTVINSGGEPGSGTYIRLRGVTSITGNNQPLMVVDGVPIDNSINNYDATSATPDVSGANSNLTGGTQPTNRGVDLNPNDIESITLLKGPAATALYGIQAASGAIIITTKKGGTGRRVSFNSSVTFDRVNQFPERQSSFAQGTGIDPNTGEFITPVWIGPAGTFGDGTPAGGLASERRLAWGPAIDTLFRTGIADVYDRQGNLVGTSSPLKNTPAYAYDVYDFFKTGLTFNNNIAISGGNTKSGFRISLGNLDQKGVIPNSRYNKTTLSVNGQNNINDKFSISGGLTYVRSVNDKVQQGSNISSIMLGLLRTPPTFDNANGFSNAADHPESYVQPDGSQRSYRGKAGYDNPYWTVNRNPFKEYVDRVFGYAQGNYQLFDWISFTYRLGGDVYAQNAKNAFDIGSNAFPAGAIHLLNYYNQQYNSDFTVNLKKNLSKDFTGSLLLGHNYFYTVNRSRQTHGSGFVLNNYLDVANATSITGVEKEVQKRTMAFYGEAHLDYKNMLFLTLTGRRETSSTLPADNNSFFYPSVGLAYEFTRMPFLIGNNVLNYGKLRASFAQVGKDAPAQGLTTDFLPAVINDGFTTGIQFPIGGNAGYQISSPISVIGNPDLKAEKTNSYEIGTDLGFYDNRISLNATYYYSKSTDVILIVPIAYSTGFSSILLNAATITNKGIEVTLNTTPINTKDFRWDVNFNFAHNKNMVVSLASGVPKVLIAGFQNGEIDAIAGKPFGQIYGSVYQRSDPNDMNSPLLINDVKDDPGYGMPIVSAQNAPVGDINPDWTGSIITNLSYKGFTLSGQLDVRRGGDIWNGTRGAMSYFGTSLESANRGTPVTFNGLLGHLDLDGNVVHYDVDGVTEILKPGAQNTVVTAYNQYYWQFIGSSFIGPAEASVEDGSFVRIRQLSLGYEIPSSVLKKARIANASITVFANNPVLWTKYTGVDPETSLAGPANGQGLDYFNNPGTKSYGIRLNIGL